MSKNEITGISEHKIGPIIVKYYRGWEKYRMTFHDRELWTNSFSIIREQYMKYSEFSTYNIEKCIEVYFGGNFRRFLRKHREQYYYQLTYCRTFRKWKKDRVKNKARRRIIKLCNKLPGEVNDVANILLTLEKHYDWEVNKDNASIAFDIHIMLGKNISDYNMEKCSRSNRDIKFKIPHSPRQAIREQKARGFIEKHEFEEYDDRFAHVLSIADRSLIYPCNILTIPLEMKLKNDSERTEGKNIIFNTMYKGLRSIGVQGHTRVENPSNRK